MEARRRVCHIQRRELRPLRLLNTSAHSVVQYRSQDGPHGHKLPFNLTHKLTTSPPPTHPERTTEPHGGTMHNNFVPQQQPPCLCVTSILSLQQAQPVAAAWQPASQSEAQTWFQAWAQHGVCSTHADMRVFTNRQCTMHTCIMPHGIAGFHMLPPAHCVDFATGRV